MQMKKGGLNGGKKFNEEYLHKERRLINEVMLLHICSPADPDIFHFLTVIQILEKKERIQGNHPQPNFG